MNKHNLFTLALIFFGWHIAAQNAAPALIPLPGYTQFREGVFSLTEATQIQVGPASAALMPVAVHIRSYFYQNTGTELLIVENSPETNVIEFVLDPRIHGEEAYRLIVSPQKIVISAGAPAGAFYAFQTLRQLLPPDFESGIRSGNVFKSQVPCVRIDDGPRFPYRGMHLDVGRHFFPVEFIKKYIDVLAMHKFNRFHWHLTEDQGWRIEIKQYPKLQELAAWRKETLIGHYSDQPHRFDGQRYGGFYTQDEIREVVRYAAERHITIVPEIELPGHSLAALSAYPELACTPGPFEAATKWGVFEDVYCPKEETFTFLENVLTEVMDLFPGEYIHIGGDECPKDRWKTCPSCQALIQKEGLKDEHGLQSYFIRRIERFLNSKGRQIIGWDEILEGGLAPNATVMSWRGIEGGIAAAKQGHKVIMTPTSHCYLDYYQTNTANEPLAGGGFLPLEKVYSYEPVPEELTQQEARFILGAQGNVWTEYMRTSEQVEYMAFPRALAIAELTWTPKVRKNYEDFSARLARHFPRLDNYGIHYSKALYGIKAHTTFDGTGLPAIKLSSLHPQGIIRYTTDGSAPTSQSTSYNGPIALNRATHLQATVFEQQSAVSPPFSLRFDPHLATGRVPQWSHPPHSSYNLGGPQALTNGISGSESRYNDSEWLGWSGKDMEAVFDLGSVKSLSEFSTRFFHSPGEWIHAPQSVEIWASADGKKYRQAGKAESLKADEKLLPLSISLKKNTKARYVKVLVKRHGIIGQGLPGEGHEAWLFVDELRLR